MILQEAIKNRRTLKVLSQENIKVRDISDDVSEIVEMGGKAPFHYINAKASDKRLKSLAPWRFYVLHGESCRKLADYFIENNIDGGKLIQMLRAAQTLIQVTWTPESSEGGDLLSEQSNIEHIAATSAAVQNMLLTATALGYENYWSSGGLLREDNFKELLGIPLDERLLASLFLYDGNTEMCKTKKGALRGRQGSLDSYSKTVSL
tara:strand:- start:7109 stop:7726 length:618 start_codon:yes stop_codon:yes gene_type:complete